MNIPEQIAVIRRIGNTLNVRVARMIMRGDGYFVEIMVPATIKPSRDDCEMRRQFVSAMRAALDAVSEEADPTIECADSLVVPKRGRGRPRKDEIR